MTGELDDVHPGKILWEDFMVPSELSKQGLADVSGVLITRVGEIRQGPRDINPE